MEAPGFEDEEVQAYAPSPSGVYHSARQWVVHRCPVEAVVLDARKRARSLPRTTIGIFLVSRLSTNPLTIVLIPLPAFSLFDIYSGGRDPLPFALPFAVRVSLVCRVA